MKTIAAISTAQATGGIGVIRISGDKSREIADRVFKSPFGKKISDTPGYVARYGKVFEGSEDIDEAIALVFRKPHSYTGEDVVEISCHGGLYVTKRVLRAILNAGAYPAEPGEFTKRAFLNGKIDLTEAEAVMDIIGANGKQAARIALAGREGALHKKIDTVKNNLISQAAHLSAWADYPDEDIPEVERESLKQGLLKAEDEIKILLKNYDAGKIIREGIDTAIVGRPNVGKSTLMNLLSGCQRSIVTDIPGTTRDIIEETIILGDIPLRLADTAGIRDTNDVVESIGVDMAKSRIRSSGLILAVFDASSELTSDDIELIEQIKGIPSVAIVNKTDLETKIDYEYIAKNIDRVVKVSALKGDGLNELTGVVTDLIGASQIDPSEGILANERQYNAATKAAECICEARSAIEYGMTLDAVTVSIEGAIQELMELTGERASEAVVNGVFSRFCVGK